MVTGHAVVGFRGWVDTMKNLPEMKTQIQATVDRHVFTKPFLEAVLGLKLI